MNLDHVALLILPTVGPKVHPSGDVLRQQGRQGQGGQQVLETAQKPQVKPQCPQHMSPPAPAPVTIKPGADMPSPSSPAEAAAPPADRPHA
jgi:hypothetical protein